MASSYIDDAATADHAARLAANPDVGETDVVRQELSSRWKPDCRRTNGPALFVSGLRDGKGYPACHCPPGRSRTRRLDHLRGCIGTGGDTDRRTRCHIVDRPDDGHLLSSAIAVRETTMALARKRRCRSSEAFSIVDLVCRDMNIALTVTGPPESSMALEAFPRYGKGRHETKLNIGDCFAYACARTTNATLLHKGEDFARTDLA